MTPATMRRRLSQRGNPWPTAQEASDMRRRRPVSCRTGDGQATGGLVPGGTLMRRRPVPSRPRTGRWCTRSAARAHMARPAPCRSPRIGRPSETHLPRRKGRQALLVDGASERDAVREGPVSRIAACRAASASALRSVGPAMVSAASRDPQGAERAHQEIAGLARHIAPTLSSAADPPPEPAARGAGSVPGSATVILSAGTRSQPPVCARDAAGDDDPPCQRQCGGLQGPKRVLAALRRGRPPGTADGCTRATMGRAPRATTSAGHAP